VIRSFRDNDTQRIWDRERARRFGPDVHRSALKRLTRLDAAESLDDLRAFPGNRLETLRGDRQEQHSIRVNDQWRICFVWTDAGPEDVEIVDYH
jgi:proteic killer suppression protein